MAIKVEVYEQPQVQAETTYILKSTKVVKDVNGQDVEIIDDNSTEYVTKSGLEQQIALLKNQIKSIEAKLKAIEEMEE